VQGRLSSSTRAGVLPCKDTIQMRNLPVSAMNSACSSRLSAMPLANENPRAITRVFFVAGSYSSTRPEADCSISSSMLASMIPPPSRAPKRVDASVK